MALARNAIRNEQLRCRHSHFKLLLSAQMVGHGEGASAVLTTAICQHSEKQKVKSELPRPSLSTVLHRYHRLWLHCWHILTIPVQSSQNWDLQLTLR